MRLGGQVFAASDNLNEWALAAKRAGYGAVTPPFGPEASAELRNEFVEVCARQDLVIAEVGVWNNPLTNDPAARADALEKAKRCLQLAEDLGAACAVNIAGSCGDRWDGPYAENFSADTFDLIVEQVREVLRAVQPKRTAYTLETMPWVFPDSPETYLELIRAIDDPGFAVHLDIVNMITSPRQYFNNAEFSRHCVETLRPWIRGVHLKDMAIRPDLTVHLEERVPGEGGLDLGAMLEALSTLPEGTPVLLEHMHHEDDYVRATAHVKELASSRSIIWN